MIMVPTDFSAAAKKAFRYAQDFAQQSRAHIILLHVVAPTESEDVRGAMRAAKKNLAYLRKGKSAWSKRCKSMVRTGIPFFEITQSADKAGVELIILGRRDSTIAGKFGDGHTSERVMRYARCPVLVVNETGRDFVAMPNEP
jgi:nucleotide-binding universal stress UspA family protein